MGYAETVCTGNNGRSPLSETIGKDHIRKKYPVFATNFSMVSSGTLAGLVENYPFPIEQSLFLMKTAYKNHAVTGKFYELPAQAKFVEQLLDLDSEKIAEKYKLDFEFQITLNSMGKLTLERAHKHEQKERDEYLANMGLSVDADTRYNKQTKPRSDVRIVWGMKQSNVDQINGIYANSKITPPRGIHVITDYADTEPLIDAFLSPDKEKVFHLYDQIADATKKAIDRFMDEEFLRHND